MLSPAAHSHPHVATQHHFICTSGSVWGPFWWTWSRKEGCPWCRMMDLLPVQAISEAWFAKQPHKQGDEDKKEQRLWKVLSLAVAPKCHQTVAHGRYRNVFDAVSVYKTDVIILVLGWDYLHYRHGLTLVMFRYYFGAGLCYYRLKCFFS